MTQLALRAVLIAAAAVLAAPVASGAQQAAGAAPAPLIRSIAVTPRPVRIHHSAAVTLQAHAGARCTVLVIYADGDPATSHSLHVAQIAPASGRIIWRWTPATKAAGPATATLICKAAHRTQQARSLFTVTR